MDHNKYQTDAYTPQEKPALPFFIHISNLFSVHCAECGTSTGHYSDINRTITEATEIGFKTRMVGPNAAENLCDFCYTTDTTSDDILAG